MWKLLGLALARAVGVGLVVGCSIVASAQQHPAFFTGEVAVGGGVYWLQFPGTGKLFGYYNYSSFPNLYHYDLGFEDFLDAADGQQGAYLYDYASGTWFYTNPASFPALYDYTLNTWITYQLNPANPTQHYTSSPRIFYDAASGQNIQLGATGNAILPIAPPTPDSVSFNGGGSVGDAPPGTPARPQLQISHKSSFRRRSSYR